MLEDALRGCGLPGIRYFPADEFRSYSEARRDLSIFRKEDPEGLVPVLWAFSDTVLAARREVNNLEHFMEGFKLSRRMIVVPEDIWEQELALRAQDPDCRVIYFEHSSRKDGFSAFCIPLRRRYTVEDVRLLADYLGIKGRKVSREDDSTRETAVHDDTKEQFETLEPMADATREING